MDRVNKLTVMHTTHNVSISMQLHSLIISRHETPMTPVQPVQENQTPAQPVEYQEGVFLSLKL